MVKAVIGLISTKKINPAEMRNGRMISLTKTRIRTSSNSDDDSDNYMSSELGLLSESNLNRRQDAEVDVLEEWFSILESTDT